MFSSFKCFEVNFEIGFENFIGENSSGLSGGGGKKSTLGPDFLTTATTVALEFFLRKFQWKFRKQVRNSLQWQRAKTI